jgi:hypothetical protein
MLIVAASSAPSSSAQTNSTWTDGTGNWSNPLNWDSGVPNGNYNAIINPGSTAQTVTLDTSVSLNSLQISGNSNTLDIAPGNTLTLQPVGSAISRNLGASIQVDSGSSLILDTRGLTCSGMWGACFVNTGGVAVNNGGTLTILAQSNSSFSSPQSGGFSLNSTGSLTSIQLNGNDSTFVFGSGNLGIIGMSDNPNNLITGVTGTETLYVNDITGAGSITNLHLVIEEGGKSVLAQGINPLIITPNSQGVDNYSGLGVSPGSTMMVNGTVNNFASGDVLGIYVGRNGSMIINGPLDNASRSDVQIGSSASLTTGNFTNSGGVTLNMDPFTNQSGPIGATLIVNGNLDNSGTIGMLGSSLVSVSGDLNNTGTVSLASNDTVRVGGSFNNGTSGILTLQQSGGTVVTGQFNNAGTVQVGAGNSLVVNGGQQFTSTAGQVVINGNLISPGGVNILGGTLSGNGLIAGSVTNSGILSPGDDPGTMSIFGNFTQTSTGTLLEQVGWINGSQASLLDVNGIADLNGTLALTLLNGYNATIGDSFILMTFWSEYGSFNTVTGLNLGNGLFLDLFYDPHDVRAVVESQPVATPEPNSLILLLVGCIPILAISRNRLAGKIATIPGTVS